MASTEQVLPAKCSGRLVEKDGVFQAVLTGELAGQLHKESHYGEYEEATKQVRLTPMEALYLVYKGRAEILSEQGSPLSLRELLQIFSSTNDQLWVDHLVYLDLRDRGYIVKAGFEEKGSFRVYKRGAEVGEEAAKYLVYVLAEGRQLSILQLANVARETRTLRKEPILAVVDSQGDITYYSLTATNLRKV